MGLLININDRSQYHHLQLLICGSILPCNEYVWKVRYT